MGKIVLLDDETINKIAAGEVIERPASVVKEIMENSIDAGATNISVEIRNGGISYIRVTDNGKGIMQDDMEIAFERHATSKLRNAEDLNDIKSMGFRGEALASIAAIARVELVSKTADNDNGYVVTIEGGNILNKEETACPNGTTITIENLFYNTPVRYKFLKKDFTESGYIEDVVTHIALVHPEIAIKLVNTGKTIIQTSGNGDIKAVIYNIYGKDVAENLIDIDYQYEDVIIKGVVGKPVISRSNRTNQLFFVNERYVKDKTLSGAAEQAFKGFVTIGKHGFLILNLKMAPNKVDVNVHPAKLEVRFQDENTIFKAVYHAIKEGLTKSDLVADTSSIDGIDSSRKFDLPEEKTNEYNNLSSTSFRDILEATPKESNENEEVSDEKFDDVINKLLKMQNMIKVAKGDQTVENEDLKKQIIEEVIPEEDVAELSIDKENEDDIKEEQEQLENIEENEIADPESQLGSEEDEEKNLEKIKQLKKQIEEQMPKNGNINSDKEFLNMYEKMFGTAVRKDIQEEQYDDENISEDFKPIEKADNVSVFEESSNYTVKPVYKFIGIAFNTYIIIEMKNELYIIDQHAAHERIMYEKIKKNYYNDENKDSQLMLLPDIITLTHKEMDIYRDNKEMFKKAGFIVDEFGENTVKLSGVPDVLLDLETKELFLEALDEINTVARTAKQEIEEKFIATVACKAAVKAHMVLTQEEVEKLLDELLALPNPFTCPHGRPTAIRMTKNDIEKKFARRG